jgi:Tfp pilus assembly protein PilV
MTLLEVLILVAVLVGILAVYQMRENKKRDNKERKQRQDEAGGGPGEEPPRK